MSDSREQFKKWYQSLKSKQVNFKTYFAMGYGECYHDSRVNQAFDGYQAAWQHQQAKIDALESQLSIAVDALEEGEKLINEISVFLIRAGATAEQIGLHRDSKLKIALTKINALKGKP